MTVLLCQIFYRMGYSSTIYELTELTKNCRFNDQEIVALSGAHALGRCHPDRSGFEGPWTFSPITLTNDFFKLLLSEKWVWKKWTGLNQYVDKKTGTLMMLPYVMSSTCRTFLLVIYSSGRISRSCRINLSRSTCRHMRLMKHCSSRSKSRFLFRPSSANGTGI
jgi:hypothetical protein